ncbi:MAG: XkdF-like putative serine protease domain-containing protein [bacterium]
MNKEKLTKAFKAEINEELGLVFGFSIICEDNGVPYFDKQGEHIPENVMLKASTKFMENSRVAKEMHQGDSRGSTVFAFPLTKEIAKSMEINTKKTGLIIAMKPDKKMLKKFKDGEFKGFSIGGFKKKEIVE